MTQAEEPWTVNDAAFKAADKLVGKILQSALAGLNAAYGNRDLPDKSASEEEFLAQVAEAANFRKIYGSAIRGEVELPKIPSGWANLTHEDRKDLPILLEKAAEDFILGLFLMQGDQTKEKLWERISNDLARLRVSYPRAKALISK